MLFHGGIDELPGQGIFTFRLRIYQCACMGTNGHRVVAGRRGTAKLENRKQAKQESITRPQNNDAEETNSNPKS